MAGTTAGRLVGDRLRVHFSPASLFRAGALMAGAGFGGALVAGTPTAGFAGLALVGAGTSFLLPLTVSAAGSLRGATAPAVARVATGGALGSFTAPVLTGGLAGPLTLTAALTLPALLVAATALPARAVQPAVKLRPKEPARTHPDCGDASCLSCNGWSGSVGQEGSGRAGQQRPKDDQPALQLGEEAPVHSKQLL